MSKQLPYNFVPNHHEKSPLEPLISHRPNENDPQLFSGWFQVELTFLSRFFTGTERLIRTNLTYQTMPKDDKKSHPFVVPLMYPPMVAAGKKCADLPEKAQFLIPPTTLKGLYANLVDKMTSARMKRINEPKHGFPFRFLNPSEKMKAGILIKDGDSLRIYPAVDAHQIVFHNNHNITTSTPPETYEQVSNPKYHQPSSTDCVQDRRKHKTFSRNGKRTTLKCIYEGPWIVANYKHQGWKPRFPKPDAKRAQIYKQIIMPINTSLILDQLPVVTDALEKCLKASWVSKDIKKAPELVPGMAVFYLTNSEGSVVAISPNYRMKWPFLDGARETNRWDVANPDRKKPRSQYGYMQDEAVGEFEKTRLSPRQRMFGYTYQEECKTEKGPKKEYLEAYAGRVAFNFGVHQHGTGSIENQPFTLPPLGQPKSSSYEHYLAPNEKSISDYGLPHLERESPPHLSGRKHYLHQPLTPRLKNKKSGTQNQNEDPEGNQNATLLAHLRPDYEKNDQPFPKFRFTVRFNRMEAWEVGLLYQVLHISEDAINEQTIASILRWKKGEELNQHTIRAVNIGMGKPLGMGSALSLVKHQKIITETSPREDREPKRDYPLNAVLDALDKKLDQWYPESAGEPFWSKTTALKALDQLLRFRLPEFSNDKTSFQADYPKEEGKIFKFHTSLHAKHITSMDEKGSAEPKVLPLAEKVWEESYRNQQHNAKPFQKRPKREHKR